MGNGTTDQISQDHRGRGATSREQGWTTHVRDVVRGHPIVSFAAAGALGAILGGLVFSRLGRLALIGAIGYAANDLWHREGRFGSDVIARSSS